jgi:hypothetical protein
MAGAGAEDLDRELVAAYLDSCRGSSTRARPGRTHRGSGNNQHLPRESSAPARLNHRPAWSPEVRRQAEGEVRIAGVWELSLRDVSTPYG